MAVSTVTTRGRTASGGSAAASTATKSRSRSPGKTNPVTLKCEPGDPGGDRPARGSHGAKAHAPGKRNAGSADWRGAAVEKLERAAAALWAAGDDLFNHDPLASSVMAAASFADFQADELRRHFGLRDSGSRWTKLFGDQSARIDQLHQLLVLLEEHAVNLGEREPTRNIKAARLAAEAAQTLFCAGLERLPHSLAGDALRVREVNTKRVGARHDC